METHNLKVLLKVVRDEWFLLTILSISCLIYYHYTNRYNFFKRKNIKFLKPKFFVGNLGPRLLLKVSIHEFNRYIYNEFKGEPYGGIFEGKRPLLMVLDQELIKQILIRDFDHFVDRPPLFNKKSAHIGRSLLNLRGQEWKSVRSILTPTFSSARLKAMMPLIEHSSEQLVSYFQKLDNKDVELKYSMGHYTLEVIGACAFGIQCDVLSNKNTNFFKLAEIFLVIPIWKRSIVLFTLMAMPESLQYLNLTLLNPESSRELINILKATKNERRSGSTKRSDFLQIMMDAAKIEHNENNSNNNTYEILSKMNYLDCFVMETLRRYPSLARLERMCTKRYTLPGSKVNIEVGEVIGIPVYGIHMDPDIYPDPEKFRPERFSEDEKKNRPVHLFMSFGGGPRNCMGIRFAMISAKLAIIALVQNFKFTTCSKTTVPVLFDKKTVLLKPESGLRVHVTSLKND